MSGASPEPNDLRGLAHELRNPLTVILGFSRTLLDEAPGPLTADQRKQLEAVQRSANRALSVVDELVGLTRTDSASPAPERTRAKQVGG